MITRASGGFQPGALPARGLPGNRPFVDPENEGGAAASLDELAALLRAHLEWEAEIGGHGLPSPRAPLPKGEGRPTSSTAPSLPGALPSPARGSTSALPSTGASGSPAASFSSGAQAEALAVAGEQADPPPAAMGAGHRAAQLAGLAAEAAACSRCRLHEGRTRSVFARGSPHAELVFVAEGPGHHEDQQGLPFVGAAGQLLDRMIAAMGYAADEVYVCNVVKCRPPQNRPPLPDEAAACAPFLEEQLRLVAPRAIVALGRSATEGLGLMPANGRAWRGTLQEYRGVPIMPTYHPAFLLRSPQYKKQVWEDLKAVMAELGRPLPPS